MTLVPAINGKKTLYDPINDFEHVIQFADSARILIARKDFPANTLGEFAPTPRQNQTRCNTAAQARARACMSARCCSIRRWA